MACGLLVQKTSGTNSVHFGVPTTPGNTVVLVICWQGPGNELLEQPGNEGKISAGGNIFAHNGSQFVFNETNPPDPGQATQNAIMNCPNVTAFSDITTVGTTPAWLTPNDRIMWAYEVASMPLVPSSAALGSLDSSFFTQTPTTNLDINFFNTWFDEDDGVCKFDVAAVTSNAGNVTGVAGTWTLDTIIDPRFAVAYTESKDVLTDIPVFTSSIATNFAANAEASFSLEPDCTPVGPTSLCEGCGTPPLGDPFAECGGPNAQNPPNMILPVIEDDLNNWIDFIPSVTEGTADGTPDGDGVIGYHLEDALSMADDFSLGGSFIGFSLSDSMDTLTDGPLAPVTGDPPNLMIAIIEPMTMTDGLTGTGRGIARTDNLNNWNNVLTKLLGIQQTKTVTDTMTLTDAVTKTLV